jgi:hypothetical protein
VARQWRRRARAVGGGRRPGRAPGGSVARRPLGPQGGPEERRPGRSSARRGGRRRGPRAARPGLRPAPEPRPSRRPPVAVAEPAPIPAAPSEVVPNPSREPLPLGTYDWGLGEDDWFVQGAMVEPGTVQRGPGPVEPRPRWILGQSPDQDEAAFCASCRGPNPSSRTPRRSGGARRWHT